MISKEAKKEWLNQPMEDWTFVKDMSNKELWSELQYQIDGPAQRGWGFKTEPRHHQLAAFLIGTYNQEFLYYMDMGLGKTKLSLDLLYYYQVKGQMDRALIVVPNDTSSGDWMLGIEQHSYFKAVELLGTTKHRWDVFMDNLELKDISLFLVSYIGLQWMLTEAMGKDGGKGTKRTAIPNLLKQFAAQFDACIFDEIHLVKNKDTLTFKLCNTIAKQCNIRYGLTGTPSGRNPIDLWSQFFLIDRGATLGEHIGMFRECFFKETTNYAGFPEYNFMKVRTTQLHERIRNRSLFYADTEVKDLPEWNRKQVPLYFSSEAGEYYKTVVEGFIKHQASWIEVKNTYHKLRMICSGFISLDVDGEKAKVIFKDNPKLEQLELLLDSVTDTSKVIIFYEYTVSGDLICKLLTKMKLKHVRLYGETKDKQGVKREFVNDPSCRVFVANSKSGNVSLNLQVANYEVFFESPVSPIIRRQAEKRAHREGQKASHVHVIDLYMKRSIEEKVLSYLKEGKDLMEALQHGKEKLYAKNG